MASANGSRQDYPFIIEMVGPAGSGKSTFTKTLEMTAKDIRIIEQPNYRQLKNLPFFLFNALQMLPVFLDIGLHGDTQWLARRSLAMMMILNGWHRRLKRQRKTETLQAFFIDQGPVSFLSYLSYYGPCFPNSPLARKWLDKIYAEWANTLNVIFLLDAPNAILYERIRGREQEHSLQTASFETAVEVLDTYRKIYEEIFVRLQKNSAQLKVIHFESVSIPKDQLHDKILNVIQQEIRGASS
jgi:shikimate kinase